jgi:predicted ester cyclase
MGTARELYEEGTAAFNAHDADRLRAICADDIEATGPGGMAFKGIDDVTAFNTSWWVGFPDARSTAEGVWIDGDTVIERGIFSGTHKGVLATPMGDIPPTGREVRGDYVQITKIRDGKVARQDLLFDRAQLMEQLGLAPTPAGAAAG